MKFHRLALLLAWIGVCAWQGGFVGVLVGLLWAGFVLWVVYTLMDGWKAVQRVTRPRKGEVDVKVSLENMEGPARRGTPVDGRPTTDDWGGIIEATKHRRLPK